MEARKFSFRGHKAPIACLCYYEESIVSADREGWVVVWNLGTKRPIALWKAHDGHILTAKMTDLGLMTHGRDSNIRFWSVKDADLEKCSRDLALLGSDDELPTPPYMEVPVNSLNFCNVDYCGGLLITPASQDSDNFDIYMIKTPFELLRVVTNYAHGTTVSESGRGSNGIIMKVLFASKSLVFVGYESGAVKAFRLKEEVTERSSKNEKLVINKDMRITCVLDSEGHKPLPVLSMVFYKGRLYTGSASKSLLVFDVNHLMEEASTESEQAQSSCDSTTNTAPKSGIGSLFQSLPKSSTGGPTASRESNASREILVPTEAFNLRHYGIQCLEVTQSTIVAGFWDGVIKGYSHSLEERFRLDRHEETIRAEEGDGTKKSLCMAMWCPPQTQQVSGRKALLRKNRMPAESVLLVGYGDGLVSGLTIKPSNRSL